VLVRRRTFDRYPHWVLLNRQTRRHHARDQRLSSGFRFLKHRPDHRLSSWPALAPIETQEDRFARTEHRREHALAVAVLGWDPPRDEQVEGAGLIEGEDARVKGRRDERKGLREGEETRLTIEGL
jgi:hypothetical protein